MDPFTPDSLIQALRSSGQFSADQLSILDLLTPDLKNDIPAFSEKLRSEHLLTAYQHAKVKRNRISDLLIGPYLIIDKIGEGGMGKVYKAAQCTTGLVVALKVVRQQLLTQGTVLKRFKREVEASSKLKHPNIVALLDAAEDRGRHYLAMEFVYGSDLSRLVKEFGVLPFAEAAEYVRQAALGLQHAHDQQLIHRDIKPSNLLVSGERAVPETGGVATVRILDMGLVRSLMDAESADKSELTRDGTVVGTPDYMAPEQAKNSSTVDGRADIYSLGCTLFFLLTGQPPFPDGSPIDKLLRHQLDPPPDIRTIRSDLPMEMVAVLNKMLAKEPKDRPQTATEVAKLLYSFTPEGLSKTPEIDFSMPVKGPASQLSQASAASGGMPKPAPQILTAEIVDAEVITTPKQLPTKPKPTTTRRKPVKLIPREADSDEIITKGMASQLRRAAASDDSDDSTSSPRTRSQGVDSTAVTRKRTARSRPAPSRKPLPWLPIFAALGGLLLLAIVAAIVFRKSDTDPPNTNGNDPNKQSTPPIVSPPKPTFSPAWTQVPDDSVAILVIYPSAYWRLARDQIEPQSAYARTMNDIAKQFAFDLRSGERYIGALQNGPNQPFVVSVEGNTISPEWEKSFGILPFVKIDKRKEANLLTFKRDGETLKIRGAIIPTRGYLLSSDESLLLQVAKRPTTTRPRVPAEILDALPNESDTQKPAFTLAATGEWQLPNGVRLADLGVERVIVRAKLVDDKFDVEAEVFGPNRERVGEFVNITLWNRVANNYPAIKPFLQAIAENIANDGWDKVGKLERLKKSQPEAWPVTSVNKWIEKLLEK